MGGDGLLREVLARRILGKKGTGKSRKGMRDVLKEGSFVKMKRRVAEIVVWEE